MRRSVRRGLQGLLGVLLLLIAVYVSIRPSNDRDWVPDQARTPMAEVEGDRLTVRNVRFNRYRSTTDFDVAYEDRTYDLRNLRDVWFMMEPLSGSTAVAHTLLSFGFGSGKYLAVSVEVRKEKGEVYSPWKAMFKKYELIYIAADERDVLHLRANLRKDPVYLYPVRITPQRARELLLSMTDRMNALAAEPEFYNTVTNTCTTNLVRHVNAIAPGKIPLDWHYLLPGYSDRLAYDLGLLDTDLPYREIREAFKINAKAERHVEDPAFSLRIRERE